MIEVFDGDFEKHGVDAYRACYRQLEEKTEDTLPDPSLIRLSQSQKWLIVAPVRLSKQTATGRTLSERQHTASVHGRSCICDVDGIRKV